jgi:hypothetical protein
MGLSERRQRRRLRPWALIILVLAFVPNVSYMGHWSSTGAYAQTSHEAHRESAEDHAAHCHTSAAKCSAQSLVGSLWAGEDAGLLSFTAPYLREQDFDDRPATDAPASRILQPPQAFA